MYVHEFLNIYNTQYPSERYRVVIALSLGHMQAFQAFPRGPLRMTLSHFEYSIATFVSAFNATVERGELQNVTLQSPLYLEYCYIVDELIDFGLLLRSSADNLWHLKVFV